MKEGDVSTLIIPPPKYGTVKYSIQELSSKALRKIMDLGNVDIIGIGEAVGIAGTVASVTVKGKKIGIEGIYITKLEIDKTKHVAIGIDLRKKADGEEISKEFLGQTEKPYISISLDMTQEDAIVLGCDYLSKYETIWVSGVGATMSKVVDVALTLPEISSEAIGIQHIRLGSIPELRNPTKLHTSLAICLSKAAAKNSNTSMNDYFKPYKEEITKTFKAGMII